MAVKWSSQGSSLEVEIASVFTPIPLLLAVPFPEITNNYEDTTTIDTTGNYAEYTPNFADPGEIEAEGFWDPTDAAHDFLMDEGIKAGNDKVLINFKSKGPVLAGTPEAAFAAYITFNPGPRAKETMKMRLRLRVSGAITYTQ